MKAPKVIPARPLHRECVYCRSVEFFERQQVEPHEAECKIKLFQDRQLALLTEIRDLLQGIQP